MPDLSIQIGGRSFTVACQNGEEHFLGAAAQMLDQEAQPILAAMGRLPEVKMLLMAGLMLADRTAAVEDELRQVKEELAQLQARPTQVQKVEVPTIPSQLTESLAEIAARVETLAGQLEEKLQPG